MQTKLSQTLVYIEQMSATKKMKGTILLLCCYIHKDIKLVHREGVFFVQRKRE